MVTSEKRTLASRRQAAETVRPELVKEGQTALQKLFTHVSLKLSTSWRWCTDGNY